MIGFLRGKVVSKQPPLLWIDVAGVGYEVEAPMSTFFQINDAEETVLLTYLHVREDAMQLFGFATEAEKSLFKTLIKVNGIGAKMALAILSTMSVSEFCQSIDASDISALQRIPGIGKKTAERLQIEMRDRLKPLLDTGAISYQTVPSARAGELDLTPAGNIPQIGLKAKAIEALMALGYKANQAENMVKSVYDESLTLEQMIKAALQGVKL